MQVKATTHTPLSPHHQQQIFYWLFGPRFFPNPVTTFTKRRLYLTRLQARPVGFLAFSWGATFGVCPRTFPARARDPCTFPTIALSYKISKNVHSRDRGCRERAAGSSAAIAGLTLQAANLDVRFPCASSFLSVTWMMYERKNNDSFPRVMAKYHCCC